MPGDPSSAAYAVVAALIVPGSDMVVENVLVNPARTGLIDTLLEMGGDIQFSISARSAASMSPICGCARRGCKGIRVDAAHAAAMLDDIPVLAIAAAFARARPSSGTGRAAVRNATGWPPRPPASRPTRSACTEGEDSLIIAGDGKVDGGGMVATRRRSPHRHELSGAGLASRNAVTVDDAGRSPPAFPVSCEAMTRSRRAASAGEGR